LEGGPAAKETFDDGSKEEEVVAVFGKRGCRCGYDDEHEVSGEGMRFKNQKGWKTHVMRSPNVAMARTLVRPWRSPK
jgi:hypothetical protein